MKVLFIHNTIPEYRIPFFVGLSDKIDVDFLFTNIDLNKKVYNIDCDNEIISKLNISNLRKGMIRYKELIKYLNQKMYNHVVMPPMDSFADLIDILLIFIHSKINKRKLLYFGEKWEAPKEMQPIKKQIKNFLQRSAFKLILPYIDMCIVSGSKSKEYFSKIGVKNMYIAIDASGVNNKKIRYDIRNNKSINKEAKIILYYGRIIKRKGLDILIRAYEKIHSNDVYLVICGDGEFKGECESLVKKLNLERVSFEGAINPKDKYTYFSQCDVFVLPSYFYNGTPEAWGLTVNEALQCKKPVIGTTAVGSAYDLLNGSNGKVVQQNDVDELANALNEFLNDEKLENATIECEKVYKKYNYDNMIDSFIAAINRA